MAWTTPKTWSAEVLTSTDLNTYVRDNQNHLRDRLEANGGYQTNEGADYTTTSTTFTDVDATNLSLTITTNGGVVYVGFSGAVTMPTNGADKAYFDVDVDATRHGLDDGILVVQTDAAGDATCASFVVQVTGLSAGSHTFKLQWKTNSGGDIKLWAGAGTSTFDVHPEFWVQEI